MTAAEGDLERRPCAVLRRCEELGHDDAPAGMRLVAGLAARSAGTAVTDAVAADAVATDAVATGTVVATGTAALGTVAPGGVLASVGSVRTLTGEWTVPRAEGSGLLVLGAQRDPGGHAVCVTARPDEVRWEREVDELGGVRVSAAELVVDGRQIVDDLDPTTGLPAVLIERCGVAGVALGLARRALTELGVSARSRSRAGNMERTAEQPRFRAEFHRAALDFRSARQLALAELDALPAHAVEGSLSPSRRATVSAALIHAQRASVEAVRFAFGKAGGSSLHSGHVMARCWGYAESLACHELFADHAEREVTRAVFGEYVPACWV